MKFEIADKVKYIGTIPRLLNKSGIIVRVCRYSTNCRIVLFSDGCSHHVFTGHLENDGKGQQLVFDFYHKVKL